MKYKHKKNTIFHHEFKLLFILIIPLQVCNLLILFSGMQNSIKLNSFLFFSFSIFFYSLGSAYSKNNNYNSKLPMLVKNFSLYIMFFVVLLLIYQTLEITQSPNTTSNKKYTLIIENLKTVEGGFLAITALIVSIISGIYIWALHSSKENAEKLINELSSQKEQVSITINHLYKEIDGLKTANLASNKIPHLELLHRIAINSDGKNKHTNDCARNLYDIIHFEKTAFDLINNHDNKRSNQIKSVSESLLYIETHDSAEYLPRELIKHLSKLLRDEFSGNEEARKLTHKLDGLLLKG